MNYSFISNNLDFKSKILDFNNCKEEDLDVSSFVINKNINLIKDFKDKLIENKDKKFLIVGDFDCDGVHSTTIIKILFNYLNINHNFYIPSRIKDGYGLNNDIVNRAASNNFDIIICLDNGIVCNESIDLAYSLGLKVFIIDHHEYEVLPHAEAIIHSNLLDKDYKETCTAGLCYLLLSYFKEDDYAMCLAGIATLADMVKVFGYNRYLLKEMIKLINKNNFYQINLLINKDKDIIYEDLSYSYIPKLNSLSRMEPKTNINVFIEYLLSNEETCKSTISSINEINDERKTISFDYYMKARKLVDSNSSIILIILDDIMEGLCGIVANKLLTDFGKPVIVLGKKDGEYKGSCRSPKDINFYEYLNNIKDSFKTFGGHDQALGVSLDENGISYLKEYILDNPIAKEEVNKQVIVINEEDINLDMIEILESLKPFGTGFVEPLFVINNLNIKSKLVVKGLYPKYVFNNPKLTAISFNSKFLELNPNFIIGKLKRDLYKAKNVTFSIEDMG